MDPQPIMQTRFIDYIRPRARSDSLEFALIQVAESSAYAPADSAPVFDAN